MNTAEMRLAAQKDGGTYYSEEADAFYSQELGLVETDNINDKIDLRDFSSFENLMKSGWQKVIIMNREEAYKEFGVMIVC